MSRRIGVQVASIAIWFASASISSTGLQAQQKGNETIAIDGNDIAGVVTSSKGSEAGVWVIAESLDLPKNLTRIVVTDDRGRYLVPDLPKAGYRVWVRGYGLVDSSPVKGRPGSRLNLRASIAPTPQAAAQYYPSNYWYSLLKVPDASQFPGTGLQGNGIPTEYRTQRDWVAAAKSCLNCHQIGNKSTREFPEQLGKFESSFGAWDHRVQVGQSGVMMNAGTIRTGRQRTLAMYADWSDRIAAGEVPVPPERPRGVERNLVLTMWDIGGSPTAVMRDEIVTDKRNPQINANGPVYIVDGGADRLVWFDPRDNKETGVHLPGHNPTLSGPLGSKVEVPSPYWGKELYWNNPGYPHSPVMDQKGRLWITTTIRAPQDQPAFCKDGATNKFAKYFPLERGGSKNVVMFDPQMKSFDELDTCFTTHHHRFASDSDNTLHFSNTGSNGDVVGWVNTRIYDETKSAEKAQGWCPAVLDTNGDGKITRGWTEPDQPVDPSKDHRVRIPGYGNGVNPVDHSAWVASANVITRLELGSSPPESCKAEQYQAPSGEVIGPHGVDIDRNGLAWVNFSSSGHFGSFDRQKCKVLAGPTATGQHCPEGWTIYESPGPKIKGTDMGADWTYVPWVDQFNTLGLGDNVPMVQGTNADALYALLPKTGEWITLRVPYPLGFYARLHDGRIDDPNGGWKGRALWSSYADLANWHIEGGKGTLSKLVKFQLRPDPLAK